MRLRRLSDYSFCSVAYLVDRQAEQFSDTVLSHFKKTTTMEGPKTGKKGLLNWDSPNPRQGPESPFPGKEGFGVHKPPFPVALKKAGKGSFRSNPFCMCSLAEKRGFFDRKLPFPEGGEMGVFGPRNPLVQKMGIRAPVWGLGNPNS